MSGYAETIIHGNGVSQALRLTVATGESAYIEGIRHLQTYGVVLHLHHLKEVFIKRVVDLVRIVLGLNAQGSPTQEDGRKELFQSTSHSYIWFSSLVIAAKILN
jgi:hypothetical protein